MASARGYGPTTTMTPTRGGQQPPTKQYYNHDGPGGTTVNYGPDKSPGYKPGPGTPDPRTHPEFFVPDPTAEQNAAWDAQHAQDVQTRNSMLANNPAYQAALQNHDPQARAKAMQSMAQQGQHDYWAAKGMQSPQEIWHQTQGQGGVTPRSVSGNYQYGPGRPGPTPPGVSQGQAAPPQQAAPQGNPNVGSQSGGSSMITGYDPGPQSQGQATSTNAYITDPRQIDLIRQTQASLYGGQGATPYDPSMSANGMAGGAFGGQNFGQAMGGIQGQMGQMNGGGNPWGAPMGMAQGDPRSMVGMLGPQTQGRTFPDGRFPTNPGPIGRPTTGPVPPMPQPQPGDPRQFPTNPYMQQPQYAPSYNGNIGYDMGGMGQMFGGGGGYGGQSQYGGGYPQNYGGMQPMSGGGQPQMQNYGGGGGFNVNGQMYSNNPYAAGSPFMQGGGQMPAGGYSSYDNPWSRSLGAPLGPNGQPLIGL